MTTYSGNCTDYVEIGSASISENLVQRVKRWARVQSLKVRMSKERQQLLEMSDSMLRDIGVTRTQAYEEAQRIDIPENRLKTLV